MTESKRSRLGDGAGAVAPTAPHATPPPAGKRPLPVQRLWRGMGLASAVAALLSLGGHVLLGVQLAGDLPEVEFHDVDEELTIPVDLFDPGAPGVEAAPTAPQGTSDPGGEPVLVADAGAQDAASDAGAPDADVSDADVPDADTRDAASDADVPDAARTPDASSRLDAGASDGGADAGEEDGGADASADAGSGAGGPRDAAGMIGMAGLTQTGPTKVTLLVNMAAARAHPVGRRLGRILNALPQWRSFLGSGAAAFDPVRDIDWILIYGPSLIKTERDAVLVRYSGPDAAVDAAIDAVASNYADGGKFEVRTAGVKAALGFADDAPRVYLRASSKLLAVVPPANANDFAQMLKKNGAKPKINEKEGVRLVVREPYRQISIRGLKFPTELEELRLWVEPVEDGGAVVHVEGTVTPPEACPDVAVAMTTVLARTNSGMVQIATGGLLNRALVQCEEDGTPKLTVTASLRQLEQLFTAVSLALGAPLDQ